MHIKEIKGMETVYSSMKGDGFFHVPLVRATGAANTCPSAAARRQGSPREVFVRRCAEDPAAPLPSCSAPVSSTGAV